MPVTEEELVLAYRGIDGTPWPEELAAAKDTDSGLAPAEHWATLVALATSRSNSHIYDALFVVVPAAVVNAPPDAELLGFDVGIVDEWNDYSSIFHEVICGHLPELRQYASRLNEHLLFSNTTDVEDYRQTHMSLANHGSDVEDDDCCHPIAVFGRRR